MRKANGYWSNRFKFNDVYLWTTNKWTTINQRTINGKFANQPSIVCNPQQMSYLKHGRTVEFSQEEFFDWCAARESKILEMLKNGDKPSIDRIDNEGNYTLENIQVISALENMTKDKSGDSSYVRQSPTVVKLLNRKVYLESHDVIHRSLVVDSLITKLRNYWGGIGFLSSLIEFGLFGEAFNYLTNDIVRSADVESKVDEFIAEEEKRINDKNQRKEDIIARKEYHRALNEARAELKAKRKNIKNHPLFNEVEDFVCRRKTVLAKGNPKVSHVADSYIESHLPRLAIIYIIENDISIDLKPVAEIRKEAKVDVKYKGVSFEDRTGLYLAQVTRNKVKHWLGRFETQEEAYEAVKNKKIELGLI